MKCKYQEQEVCPDAGRCRDGLVRQNRKCGPKLYPCKRAEQIKEISEEVDVGEIIRLIRTRGGMRGLK
jgi:hypothetical protein